MADMKPFGNDVCPVNKAVECLNKKWSIEIIRDMFFGKKRFKDFLEGNPNLSNKVLSECLKNLENKGIIEKKVLDSTPISTEYYLTEKGMSLNKVIYEMVLFAIYNDDEGDFAEKETRKNVKNHFKEVLNIVE